MAENKQKTIADISYDRSGFGSKATTLKDARAKNKEITMKDVDEFFRKNVEIKRKARGMNSFVAPHNNHSFQIDLFFYLEPAKVQGWFGLHRCLEQIRGSSTNQEQRNN